MNARQKRFCEEYLVNCNAARAAVCAGFAPASAKRAGFRLLHDVRETREYIAQELDRLHSERTADAREIVEYLTSVMRGECTDADDAPTIRDRLKAAELLGKRYGIFTDKVSLDVQPVVLINDLPDEPPDS